MHRPADAVPDIVADNAVAVRLGKLLDRGPDVAESVAGNRLLNGCLEAVARDLAQALPFARDLAAVESPGVVANPTVQGSTGVDREDIPLLEHHGI